MEWYHWLLIAIVASWIACVIFNYVLLRKIGADAVIEGEGGYYWIFLAPIWVVPLFLHYRYLRKNALDRVLEEIRRRREAQEGEHC